MTTTESELSSTRTSARHVFLALYRQRRVVLGIPFVAGLIAVAISFLLPKWYLATARILPPQQSQSSAVAILGQVGGLASMAGQHLGVRTPSDVYIAMLRSRTVTDAIIHKFHLQNVYDEDTMVDTRKELSRHATIGAGRDAVIAIEVEDRDPERAAAMANAYIEELSKLTLNLAVTEASQRRLFFEAQLKKAKDDLVTAELELKTFTQKAGLVNPQGQVSVTVAAAAALRAQISAKEIQLTAMRTFATEANPDVERTRQELAGLRSELARIGKDHDKKGADVLVSFGKAPEVSLEFVRRFRDLKYYETLFEVLAKQYEIARIDEAKDATLIQTLDVAVSPDKKSRPLRSVIVLVTVFIALVVAVVLGIVREASPEGR
jgi:tyrosine-protein kinase Etk/Wzc